MNEHKHDDLTEDKAAPQPDEKKTQEKVQQKLLDQRQRRKTDKEW